MQRRSSGILLHVTSLPTPYGIGDLGPSAWRWIEMLAAARQRWWQILPLGPPGAGDSPYNAFSAFAGNPLLISPEALVADGLLESGDLQRSRLPPGPIRFDRVRRNRQALLDRAFERFDAGKAPRLDRPLARFAAAEAEWVDDYALFEALRSAHGDDWTRWPVPLRQRDPDALADARRQLDPQVRRQVFWQFLFHRQLEALRAHARRHNVGIIGDLPIFVSPHSADVWAHPGLFELDRAQRPTAVAGVPPDLFSATGQRWGNPLYNWSAMKRQGFAWWIRRMRAVLRQCDVVRLDHFRGFEAFWRIPASSPTAIKGRWVKAPGAELLETLRREIGSLPVIAEDLGVITPPVEQMRDAFNLPGMRVLQFAFGEGGGTNPHLPHNYVRNCVAYTGTHDNDTAVGWYGSASHAERLRLLRYVGPGAVEPNRALIRAAWTSIANLAICPAQDLLALPRSARMNTPGTDTGNWRWRLNDFDPIEEVFERLAALTEETGRA